MTTSTELRLLSLYLFFCLYVLHTLQLGERHFFPLAAASEKLPLVAAASLVIGLLTAPLVTHTLRKYSTKEDSIEASIDELEPQNTVGSITGESLQDVSPSEFFEELELKAGAGKLKASRRKPKRVEKKKRTCGAPKNNGVTSTVQDRAASKPADLRVAKAKLEPATDLSMEEPCVALITEPQCEATPPPSPNAVDVVMPRAPITGEGCSPPPSTRTAAQNMSPPSARHGHSKRHGRASAPHTETNSNPRSGGLKLQRRSSTGDAMLRRQQAKSFLATTTSSADPSLRASRTLTSPPAFSYFTTGGFCLPLVRPSSLDGMGGCQDPKACVAKWSGSLRHAASDPGTYREYLLFDHQGPRLFVGPGA